MVLQVILNNIEHEGHMVCHPLMIYIQALDSSDTLRIEKTYLLFALLNPLHRDIVYYLC